jgi:hypothetical protein
MSSIYLYPGPTSLSVCGAWSFFFCSSLFWCVCCTVPLLFSFLFSWRLMKLNTMSPVSYWVCSFMKYQLKSCLFFFNWFNLFFFSLNRVPHMLWIWFLSLPCALKTCSPILWHAASFFKWTEVPFYPSFLLPLRLFEPSLICICLFWDLRDDLLCFVWNALLFHHLHLYLLIVVVL